MDAPVDLLRMGDALLAYEALKKRDPAMVQKIVAFSEDFVGENKLSIETAMKLKHGLFLMMASHG